MSEDLLFMLLGIFAFSAAVFIFAVRRSCKHAADFWELRKHEQVD